jgi:hypothetical protein
MLRKKPKKKERIKVKTRVQLKNDLSSDGVIVAKGAAKAQWKVKWTEGPHKGSTTDQSSKSLRAWQLDLSAVEEEDEEEEVSSDDDGEEKDNSAVDYGSLKRKFDAHAKSLVGKKIEVSQHNINHFQSLITSAPTVGQGQEPWDGHLGVCAERILHSGHIPHCGGAKGAFRGGREAAST